MPRALCMQTYMQIRLIYYVSLQWQSGGREKKKTKPHLASGIHFPMNRAATT